LERGKERRRNIGEDMDEKLSTLLRGRSPVGYVTCDSRIVMRRVSNLAGGVEG